MAEQARPQPDIVADPMGEQAGVPGFGHDLLDTARRYKGRIAASLGTVALAATLAFAQDQGPIHVQAQSGPGPGTGTPFPTAQMTPTTEGTVSASSNRPNVSYLPLGLNNAEPESAGTGAPPTRTPTPLRPTDKPPPSPPSSPTHVEPTATATKEASVIPEGAYLTAALPESEIARANGGRTETLIPEILQVADGEFGLKNGTIKPRLIDFEAAGSSPVPYEVRLHTPFGTGCVQYDPTDQSFYLATGWNLNTDVRISVGGGDWEERILLLQTDNLNGQFEYWIDNEQMLHLTFINGDARISQQIALRPGASDLSLPGMIAGSTQTPGSTGMRAGFDFASENQPLTIDTELYRAFEREGVTPYLSPDLENVTYGRLRGHNFTNPDYVKALLNFNGASLSRITRGDGTGLYPAGNKAAYGIQHSELTELRLIKQWQRMHGLSPTIYDAHINAELPRTWENESDDDLRAEFDRRATDAFIFGSEGLTEEEQQKLLIVVFNSIYPYSTEGPGVSAWVEKFPGEDFVHRGFQNALRAGAKRVGQRIDYMFSRYRNLDDRRDRVFTELKKQQRYTFTEEGGAPLLTADGHPYQFRQSLTIAGEFNPEDFINPPSGKPDVIKDAQKAITDLTTKVDNIDEIAVEIGIPVGAGPGQWNAIPESKKPVVLANIMESVLQLAYDNVNNDVTVDGSNLPDVVIPYLSHPVFREQMMNFLNQREVTRRLQSPNLSPEQRSQLQLQLRRLQLEHENGFATPLDRVDYDEHQMANYINPDSSRVRRGGQTVSARRNRGKNNYSGRQRDAQQRFARQERAEHEEKLAKAA